MQISTISATEAPSQNVVTNPYVAALHALAPDEVLRITPDEGQSVRGVKVAVGRTASNHGFNAESWDVDGVVYVRVNHAE